MTHPNGTQPPPTVKSPHQMEAARSDADQHLGPPVGGTPQNRPKNYGGESNLFASILKNTANSVPTGRVIKYPTKCALFAPPGGVPPGEGGGTPPRDKWQVPGGNPLHGRKWRFGPFWGVSRGVLGPPRFLLSNIRLRGPGGPQNGQKWPKMAFFGVSLWWYMKSAQTPKWAILGVPGGSPGGAARTPLPGAPPGGPRPPGKFPRPARGPGPGRRGPRPGPSAGWSTGDGVSSLSAMISDCRRRSSHYPVGR